MNKKEEFKISGKELLSKIEELIKEGNIRKIIIKNDDDKVVFEIPLTIGAIGFLLAPTLAAIGAAAALLTNCTIIVERD